MLRSWNEHKHSYIFHEPLQLHKQSAIQTVELNNCTLHQVLPTAHTRDTWLRGVLHVISNFKIYIQMNSASLSTCTFELVHSWNNKKKHKPMWSSTALTILTDFVTLVTLGCLLSACECSPLKNNNVPRNVCRLRPFDTELWKCMQSPMRAESNLLRHKRKTTNHIKWVTARQLTRMSTYNVRRYRLLNRAVLLNHYATLNRPNTGCCKNQTVSRVCGDSATVTNVKCVTAGRLVVVLHSGRSFSNRLASIHLLL